MPAHRILVVSHEVGELKRLFDFFEENFNGPASLVEVTHKTCRPNEVLGDEGHVFVSPEGKNRHGLEEIPPEELANAMYEVLVDFHSCETDTLYRETVKLFGFSAVTAKARKYLEAGFLALKQSGRI